MSLAKKKQETHIKMMYNITTFKSVFQNEAVIKNLPKKKQKLRTRYLHRRISLNI